MPENEKLHHFSLTDDEFKRTYRVTPETQEILEKLAAERGLNPKEVLAILIRRSEEHDNFEKAGLVVKVETNGKDSVWKLFKDRLQK